MQRLGVMVYQRMRRQGGFGLIELLIAMTILVIGLMGIVAAFSAAAVSLQRASRTSNAATVADAQMEGYRALSHSAIRLDGATISNDPLYRTDPACGAVPADCAASNQVVGGSASCAVLPRYNSAAHAACAHRTQVGADGISYRVDVYIKPTCALGGTPPTCTGSRPVKLVTVVVREGTTPRVLFRVSSTFDAATGGE